MLELTEEAQRAVSQFMEGAEEPAAGLRVHVSDGGCAGLQYGLRLEPEAQADDHVLHYGEVSVFVDPQSATLLEGVTVDFVNSLQGAGFTFNNPNASASCGCGQSFSA